ncbi:MAG: 23S rRNA (uracil(1939)-C(5))-methyltransferase RlmD [Candidatus Sumerlaeia bacterium]
MDKNKLHSSVKSKPKIPGHIQKNALVELDILDLAYGGKGVAKVDGYVVFVKNAIPGDRVKARITKRQKNHAEAIMEEILSPSPERIEAPCPLFGECGGCTWQNIPYRVQLAHKQKQAEEVCERLGGGARPDEIRPIIASPEEWRYRNKMDYTFGFNADKKRVLGFHEPAMFWRIIDVQRCLLQPEPIDFLLQEMTRYMYDYDLSVYNQKSHKGFLRHLIIRHSTHSDGIICLLLTHEGELPDKEKLVERLTAACPQLQGFVWGINTGIADIARLEREAWQWGEPQIYETLGDLKFRVSPLSFFQVNTPAAEKLYTVIRELLGDSENTRLLDAYCGTGSIGLFCADRVKELVGIEIVKEAIWDARENAERNGVENCTFLAGHMRDALPLAMDMPGGPFGRIIMDPPRGGMDKRSLRGILEIKAPVLIYVSCNPSTLARDLVTITEAGYHPTVMQPVDLFPQTYHIETVIRFDLQA